MNQKTKQSSGQAGSSPRNRRLGNQAIGDRLRQMYEGVVSESIPDEFLKLLEEAEANEKADADKIGTSEA